jgi:predicted restriction endonuclease
VIHWSAGGPTDLANLLPLCQRHHTAIHHGGWHIARGDDNDTTSSHPGASTHSNDPADNPTSADR